MTITYLLITHLCVADIFGCVLDMPLILAQFVFNVQGKILHVISDINFVVCSAISLLNCLIINLMCLSRRDAFNILSDPVLTVPKLNIILPVIWTVCVSVSVSMGTAALLFGRKQWYLQSHTDVRNVGNSIIDIGSGIISVFCVLGTFLNMITSFCLALRKIKAHNAMLQRSMIQSRLDLERKMNLSALILTSAFLVSWMPWLIVRSLHLVTADVQSDIAAIVTAIIGINHCINPLVYAGTISELRREIGKFLKNSFKYPCSCWRRVVRQTRRTSVVSSKRMHPESTLHELSNVTTTKTTKTLK
ncbi:uncharacterized protein LOC116303556 [Actinia tenebrosa]|uniref:Uncharacterized protein LOC116303556 n=1 Tax=Actinia tenebrosa TaxID=6105 RepID=A0A6P8IQ05_ACTTE|nr:uncharacterized protein LOC116303556 [Actinia tenebrosa]